VLLGRREELARIEQALAEARLGHGQALVIEGEPGIGKTELLAYAAAAAPEMSVLSAHGVQFEADVPYAGLHELLLPALGLLDRLPNIHSAALRSSLGLGERIESDRLIIGAAALGLISAYAELKPLLVVIDDGHWLDRASAEALAFAARRLGADAVAMLIAIRGEEDSPFLAGGLPKIHVVGLDPTSATALLEQVTSDPVPAEVAAWLMAATAGNPLALLELGPEAARLEAPGADLPMPIATSVERAYLRRVGGLASDARRVLLLMAASGTAEPHHVALAAARLGLDAKAVDEAEAAAGIIVLNRGRLEFVHPLARAATYHAASPADRRAAHRALAEVMTEPDFIDRRAWHLAASATGPDPASADAMDGAGARAGQRTAHAAAAAAFEEAARLTEDGELRARRLFNSAQNAWLAGLAERAVRSLDRASAMAEGLELRCDIQGLLGHIAMRQGHVDRGQQLLVAAASAIEASDRLRSIRLLGDACISAYGFGHPEKRLDAARQALHLSRPNDPPEFGALAHVAYGTHAVLAAAGSDGPAHMRQTVALFGAIPPERMDALLLLAAGIAGLFLREAKAGRDLLDRALLLARDRAPAGALPMLLFCLGRDAATTERWAIARANYEEGARLAAETTQSIWQANILAGLAWLDAYEGREQEARDHAAMAAEMAGRHGMGLIKAWSAMALGQLEIGLGRPEAAIPHLLECEAALEDAGISDPDIAPAPDLVDVYVRLGRIQEAQHALAAFAPIATAKGQPYALARAARARALLAGDAEIHSAFEAAMQYHSQTTDSFERARTELLFGERLRRARRRVEARRQLRSALRTFERLGAAPWANRAMTELTATGETARPRDDSQRLTLTPQELQVALAIAEGRTTREAAAKLYLSPKTIEYHLRSIYDKLEIRSREELVIAIGVHR
jgi:DNA-binding CsgD family transcriptional regulator